MRIPLNYQRTEYDCGPTSLLNAVSFLFARDEIPPDILRYVFMYTLDGFNDKGEACKNGTSQIAMMFLSNWLSQYAKARNLSVSCEYLSGDRVKVSENSEITQALQQGGTAVARLHFDCWHYVTLTGLSGNSVEMFDPYYYSEDFSHPGISHILDRPCDANRLVSFEVLNSRQKETYALGPIETREAILLFNSFTRRTPERTIEYFI
ncbi:MAG: peptidase C39 [Clostridiales bacterium]|jgi:hypothetical protein|nr:peptidase C39 [Clostridiales bacterium]MDR2750855.1 peptidase C39 [Clostridiales bacterium]